MRRQWLVWAELLRFWNLPLPECVVLAVPLNMWLSGVCGAGECGRGDDRPDFDVSLFIGWPSIHSVYVEEKRQVGGSLQWMSLPGSSDAAMPCTIAPRNHRSVYLTAGYCHMIAFVIAGLFQLHSYSLISTFLYIPRVVMTSRLSELLYKVLQIALHRHLCYFHITQRGVSISGSVNANCLGQSVVGPP